ncbi:hypothetical protein A9K71_22330 [Mesorhizobium sp. WSM3873]|nr:hypothetical protein A9K71_22330 [Mesorhizobium sp. WSM3873]
MTGNYADADSDLSRFPLNRQQISQFIHFDKGPANEDKRFDFIAYIKQVLRLAVISNPKRRMAQYVVIMASTT